jgi:hypothetical protein
MPAFRESRDFAVAGGLMSYAGSFMESHRQAGIQTGRILKGDITRPFETRERACSFLAAGSRLAVDLREATARRFECVRIKQIMRLLPESMQCSALNYCMPQTVHRTAAKSKHQGKPWIQTEIFF